MVYIYIASLFTIVLLKILCNIKGIKVVRVFGFELFVSLLMSLCLLVIIMQFILPIPQYYIKQQGKIDRNAYIAEYSLNKILEDEAHKAGIQLDKGTFKIIESYGLNFNHLFLCTYQVNGEEEARLFHFEKNIFGNMKPKYTLSESTNLIKKSKDNNDYYSDYFEDGIFGGYLLTAGMLIKIHAQGDII